MKRLLLIPVFLLCVSCIHVASVNVDTSVGDEIRPDSNRESLVLGATTKLKNGVKLNLKYRNRLTDFERDSVEHGVFFGVSVPIWKAKK